MPTYVRRGYNYPSWVGPTLASLLDNLQVSPLTTAIESGGEAMLAPGVKAAKEAGQRLVDYIAPSKRVAVSAEEQAAAALAKIRQHKFDVIGTEADGTFWVDPKDVSDRWRGNYSGGPSGSKRKPSASVQKALDTLNRIDPALVHRLLGWDYQP